MRMDEQRSLKDIPLMVSELANVEDIKKVAIKALSSGINPADVVDAVSKGLEVVGEKYEKGDYFLSELIMAGVIASEIVNAMNPYFGATVRKPVGKVVIGTVKGDLHDIGKNIVIAMLSSGGFNIVDLGIDVPCERFVETVEKERPDILAMSCLLTVAMDEMKRVIDKISEASLRKGIKVMIGGRPITPQFAEEIGADGYGGDAIEAVKIAKSLIERNDDE